MRRCALAPESRTLRRRSCLPRLRPERRQDPDRRRARPPRLRRARGSARHHGQHSRPCAEPGVGPPCRILPIMPDACPAVSRLKGQDADAGSARCGDTLNKSAGCRPALRSHGRYCAEPRQSSWRRHDADGISPEACAVIGRHGPSRDGILDIAKAYEAKKAGDFNRAPADDFRDARWARTSSTRRMQTRLLVRFAAGFTAP